MITLPEHYERMIASLLAQGKYSSAEEVIARGFATLREEATGADLVTAIQASPYKEIDIEPARARMPVRDADC